MAGAAPGERLDLAGVVRARVDAWSALAQERGLTLVAETDGTPSALAVPQRVRQVLDNLVENAVEVSPQTLSRREAPRVTNRNPRSPSGPVW